MLEHGGTEMTLRDGHLHRLVALVAKAAMRAGIIALVVFAAHGIASPALANCVNDSTTVRIDDKNVVRLREYICRTKGAQTPQLRVQLHRLNDMAMSALMYDAVPQSQQKIFGGARVVENAVYRELRVLFDRFGTDDNISESYVTLNSPLDEGPSYHRVSSGLTKGRTVPVLINRQGETGWTDFPQPQAVLTLESGGGLPPGYNQSYRNSYWRYLSKSAFRNYERKAQEYNRLISDRLKTAYQYHANFGRSNRRDIDLPLYFGKRRWPRHFVVLVATKSEPGCGDGGWSIGFWRRDPVIDVVLIENISRQPISVDGLTGVSESDVALRTIQQSRSLRRGRSKPLTWTTRTLAPGDKLVIPVRITLPSPVTSGTWHISGDGAKPKLVDYVYGPEIVVKGLNVDGERINLNKRASNLLALTTDCECGSCPYVYYWDRKQDRWRRRGKVIHTANRLAAEGSETVSFEGLVSKFRIAEEEAELALINHARLVLELDDSQKLAIAPTRPDLMAKDGRYMKVFMGQAADVTFDLPEGLDASRVKRSHFSVTGYYRRYSDIIAETTPEARLTLLPKLD